MISLLIRNLLFTILQPGVVVFLVPYLILKYLGEPLWPTDWTIRHYLALVTAGLGIVIGLSCILRFATEGKGTISPLDPTTRLIVRGLYRHSRNPMYVGATLTLIGWTIFYWSPTLLIYSAVIFIGFNLFIRLHEEPRLRREFGDEYDAYTKKVRRWL
jgi:protein-S-isoprenylcysteine O-methyltransferase Ste14